MQKVGQGVFGAVEGVLDEYCAQVSFEVIGAVVSAAQMRDPVTDKTE